MIISDWLDSILNLFYPRVCAACGDTLLKGEETVCLKCRYTLPRTSYERYPDNPLAQSFLPLYCPLIPQEFFTM